LVIVIAYSRVDAALQSCSRNTVVMHAEQRLPP
jgi:hypothetical protein